MKLGVVVHCPSPHQKVWLDELFDFADDDILVAYAYPNSPNRDWGMHVARGRTVQVPGVRGLSGGHRLQNWVADLDRDIWVLGSAFSYPRTQALASVFADLEIPWVYSGEPPRPRGGVRGIVRDWLLGRILRRCHGVIATGAEPARRYAHLLGDGRPVTSVPYYIPLEEWLTLPPKSPPHEDEPIRFLTLAQLISRKGIDILIEACGLLPTTGWRLDVYGDGPERRRLQTLVNRQSLPITLHRHVAFAQRTKVFLDAHCFVFPSRWDGWGMAPVEALAAGLPVIASDQTMSAYDFIQNGVNGWILPCEPKAFAHAMRALISRPNQIPLLSAAARESVSKYDPRNGAGELVRFCRELLSATQSQSFTR